ncbi:hypothetical protein TKK_0004232 [Trichogramma kaykai]|uniref:Translation initiation factor 3 N-terminal domain-containing protein n=1 Tax=Trichogramma kaykai TaxID=54128 RepID=A0ABD2XKN3_9HYME
MTLSGLIRTIAFRKILSVPIDPLYEICVTNQTCKIVSSTLLARRCFHKESEDSNKVPERNAPLKPKVKKGLTSPEIMLITPENEVNSVTMEHAEKLALRRNLKLIKIIDYDTKTQKPIYKLMSTLEFFEADLKNKQEKKKNKDESKEAKLFLMSSKIYEHDLHIKLKQMKKLLKKKHDVNVYISHDGNPTKAEETVEIIGKELDEISVIKNRVKKQNTIKLFLIPKNVSTDVEKIEKGDNLETDNATTVKV